MPIYLSYLEIKGHAAMFLSEQQHANGPCRIICDVGFGYAPDIPRDGVGYFTTHKGHVREETNASRALYSSSADVKHRTFELSQEEVTNFFKILNRDRRVEATPITQGGGSITVVGGPDYQQIKNNCKTYTIGVLKEIGILDSENLSNYFIQRTGTTNNLLKNLTNQDIYCPLKDQLLEKIITVLPELNIQMNTFLERSNEIKDIGEREQFINNIEEILQMSNYLLEQKNKIGIMQSLNKKFGQISSLLEPINAHINIQSKDQFKAELLALEELSKKVGDLSNKGQLDFYWKTTPPVAKRIHLNNFNIQEKAIYLTKAKGNEISDGLNLMLIEIDRQLNLPKLERHLQEDLIVFKEILQKQKTRFDKTNNIFQKKINSCKQENILFLCTKRQKALEGSIELLEKNINNFRPKSSESFFILRFFKNAIAYIRKDFPTIDVTISNIRKDIRNIKKSVGKNQDGFFRVNNHKTRQRTAKDLDKENTLSKSPKPSFKF